SVDHGTEYGFLGANDAGKTTMRMLISLTQPTDDQAWIDGTPVLDRDAIRDWNSLDEFPYLGIP
ncbi:ATP-binding cassette domain-containing protein, partial [Halorubrum sp. CBA1125]|uniref:ATP-binding cassette domain-containing protein n=1 Tax=Halorubrum sp. CBA1125 TaxID=2668072 RepID=UPI0012E932B2